MSMLIRWAYDQLVFLAIKVQETMFILAASQFPKPPQDSVNRRTHIGAD